MATARQPNSPARPGGRVVDQHWDPARYQRNAGFVAVLGQPVVELLAPRPDERILDLGCGEGTLTAVFAPPGRASRARPPREQGAPRRGGGPGSERGGGTRGGSLAREVRPGVQNAALYDPSGAWTLDYVRLRFAAVKRMRGTP